MFAVLRVGQLACALVLYVICCFGVLHVVAGCPVLCVLMFVGVIVVFVLLWWCAASERLIVLCCLLVFV